MPKLSLPSMLLSVFGHSICSRYERPTPISDRATAETRYSSPSGDPPKNPEQLMPEMSGGQAVIAALKLAGVQTVFGIPGTYNLHLYDALQRDPSIRHILARHEGGAALMADGYARASGRPGLCLTIGGPGATNALTGLVTAYAESSPVLLITTEIDKKLLGQDRGVSHEIKQQLDIFKAALGQALHADTVAGIPAALHELMAAMSQGRPRPAYLEIPWNILGERDEVSLRSFERGTREKPGGDPQAIEAAVQLLEKAKTPLIFSGLGTVRAGASFALRALAEHLSAPVITTANGKGSIPEDHPLALGAGVGRNPILTEALATADVVLAVGTSFDTWTMRDWTLEISGRMIRIDIAAEQLRKNYTADIAIHGDARSVLKKMSESISLRQQRREWAAELARAARMARSEIESQAQTGPEILRQLRSSLPRDAILAVDTTMILQWVAWNLEIYEPNSLLLPWNSGTLGFALPAALGAQAAFPERPVIALVGDGGFLFTGQELATAAQHHLPIITILFNNKAHGSIKKQQIDHFEGRVVGVDLDGPDFVAFAEAMGVCGKRVTSPEELGLHIHKALADRTPTLLEIPVGLNELLHPWTS